MKDVIDFIPFLWDGISSDARFAISFITIMLIAIGLILAGGFKIFIIACIVLGCLALVGILLSGLIHVYRQINAKWTEYKLIKETEAQVVIDRLSGVHYSSRRR